MADAIHPSARVPTAQAPRDLTFHAPRWGKVVAVAVVAAWMVGFAVNAIGNEVGSYRLSCYYAYPYSYNTSHDSPEYKAYLECLQERYARQVDGYRVRQAGTFLASAGRLGISAVLLLVGFITPNPKYARILLVVAGAYLIAGGLSQSAGSPPSMYGGYYGSTGYAAASQDAAPSDNGN